MTNRLVLVAHWSVRQKLNHVSSVQFIVPVLCRVCSDDIYLACECVFQVLLIPTS